MAEPDPTTGVSRSSSRRGIVLLILLAAFGLCAEPHAVRADDTAGLTPQQQQQIQVAEKLWKKVFDHIGNGQFAEAEQQLREAITIERNVYGDRHERTFEILGILADLQQLQQKIPESLVTRTEIMQLLEHRFGTRHWRTVDARLAIAEVRLRIEMSAEDRKRLAAATEAAQHVDQDLKQGHYAEALAKAEEIAAVRRQLLGPGHRSYALSLSRVASIHSQLGHIQQAEDIYLEAIRIEEETLGEDHPEVATTLNNLAVQCDLYGDVVRAERLYQRALQIRQQALGEQHTDYASSLNNLAVHYAQVHDPERAEALYRQALEIKRGTVGEQHPDFITSVGNLGRFYRLHNRFTDAEPLLQQAHNWNVATFGPTHPQTATSLAHLAALHVDQFKYDLAHEELRDALKSLDASQGRLHPAYLQVLQAIADLHLRQGEAEEADVVQQRAVDLGRELFGTQNSQMAHPLAQLALIRYHRQNSRDACELARSALSIDRVQSETLAVIQSERQQFAAARASLPERDVLLAVLADRGTATATEYEEILRHKGRVWRRQRRARALAFAGATPELANAALQWRSAVAARAQFALNDKLATSSDRQQKLSELTTRVDASERSLMAQSELVRTHFQNIPLQDLLSQFSDGIAIVDMVAYAHPLPVSREAGLRFQLRYLAFVLRPGTPEIAVVPLGAAAPLKAAIRTWLKSHGTQPEARAAALELRKGLWEPLLPLVRSAEAVLLSPDGDLARIPWNALPGADPEHYLIEETALSTIPSVQALQDLRTQELPSSPAPEGNLLLVGNIDYDHAGSTPPAVPRPFGRALSVARGAEWKRFLPLEGTRGELATIEKLYRESFGTSGMTVLEQADADEDRFCREASRHKFLHLATHGFFTPESRRNDSGGGARIPSGLQSGIVLSGANRPVEPERADGILTAAEVECLDLRGVQVAVLSACDTGVGAIAEGEGLLGLQRSFQVAGAQTVVASLWEVDDRQTRALMERFYANLLTRQMGTLAALRDAQLWMLREGPRRGLVRVPDTGVESPLAPPHAWAAFVLSGDWR